MVNFSLLLLLQTLLPVIFTAGWLPQELGSGLSVYSTGHLQNRSRIDDEIHSGNSDFDHEAHLYGSEEENHDDDFLHYDHTADSQSLEWVHDDDDGFGHDQTEHFNHFMGNGHQVGQDSWNYGGNRHINIPIESDKASSQVTVPTTMDHKGNLKHKKSSKQKVSQTKSANEKSQTSGESDANGNSSESTKADTKQASSEVETQTQQNTTKD